MTFLMKIRKALSCLSFCASHNLIGLFSAYRKDMEFPAIIAPQPPAVGPIAFGRFLYIAILRAFLLTRTTPKAVSPTAGGAENKPRPAQNGREVESGQGAMFFYSLFPAVPPTPSPRGVDSPFLRPHARLSSAACSAPEGWFLTLYHQEKRSKAEFRPAWLRTRWR
jgi:hypothetical protein